MLSTAITCENLFQSLFFAACSVCRVTWLPAHRHTCSREFAAADEALHCSQVLEHISIYERITTEPLIPLSLACHFPMLAYRYAHQTV